MPAKQQSIFSRFRAMISASKRERADTAVPANQRAYIVGDIHGRIDLLQKIHEQIKSDSRTYPGTKYLIYLGDYIDRGHESRNVVEELISHPLPGFEPVFLKGNHEDALLNSLNDFRFARDWFQFGGDATVLSYGVKIAPGTRSDEILKVAMDDLSASMPPIHLQFYAGLRTSYEIGDYFCVHAGVHPGRALHRQRDEDLMWIRDEFLASRKNHGKIIVHGHSVSDSPEERTNRIGIDTGAYYSNHLTCLVLEGSERRYLQT